MPGFNQTGPMGKGSMTGRKMGLCSNFGEKRTNQDAEKKENIDANLSENIQARGFGFGRGMRRRNRFRANLL